MCIPFSEPVQTSQSVAIIGGEAYLPCNTTAPGRSHPPLLVIWYKNGGGDPVYRWVPYSVFLVLGEEDSLSTDLFAKAMGSLGELTMSQSF